MSSRAVRWHAANTFSHRAFPAARLAALRQPLAGEIAARRALLEGEGRLRGPLPSALLRGDDEPLSLALPPVERPPLGALRAVA